MGQLSQIDVNRSLNLVRLTHSFTVDDCMVIPVLEVGLFVWLGFFLIPKELKRASLVPQWPDPSKMAGL